MLSTFRNEIPGYGRLPDATIRGEVLKVIRENVDICLDWVAGRPAPGPRRFENFRASAQNRAAEGMPLEDLLRAYRRGGTAAWRVIVAAATPDERDALPRAAELVMDYLDLVSGTVTAAYMEEREHHVSERERGLRALLNALLRGEALGAAHHEAAERLGFPLGVDVAAFALTIPGEGARAHALAAASLRAAAGALALTEGDRVVGLAAPRANSDSALPAGTLPAGAVAVVDVEVPREELFASLADVRYGIDIALRRGQAGVVPLRALALDLLLAHAPRVATDLRERVVGPLGPQDGRSRGDLLETVATYIGLGRDRKQAAKRLHIHPNTLDHRLRRARELTGLDLDDPEDLATMVLALRQLR